MTARSPSAKTWSTRNPLSSRRLATCRLVVTGWSGSSERTRPDISETQWRPALAVSGWAKRSGSLPRFHIQIVWWSANSPTTGVMRRRSAESAVGSLNMLRKDESFNTLYDAQPQLIQSGALLALIVPVVVFLLAQRVFLQGIDLSGVQK